MKWCGYPEVPETRQGENHEAVRFGGRYLATKAWLDGVELVACCMEAFAGDEGWVVVIAEPRKQCFKCLKVHYEKRYGRVRIEHRDMRKEGNSAER